MKKQTILSMLLAIVMIFALANFNPVTAQQSVEDQYWDAVKTSKYNDDLESYIKEYPKGKYVVLARLKIRQNSRGKTKGTPNTKTGANYLITPNSVGNIRIGMTIADARKVFKNAKFDQYNYSEEGIWVEVTKGKKRLMRFTTDQQDVDAGDEEGKVKIDESARIDRIEFSDARYKTGDGIRVGTTIKDAEKNFGKMTKIDFWGLDVSEHIEFTNTPKGYFLRVVPKKVLRTIREREATRAMQFQQKDIRMELLSLLSESQPILLF